MSNSAAVLHLSRRLPNQGVQRKRGSDLYCLRRLQPFSISRYVQEHGHAPFPLTLERWAHRGFEGKQEGEFMLFICVEYQTPADDSTLLESPHTVSMYYEVESKPEAWQVANHYRASNVKCDASTVVVKEISAEKVERLRAEGVAFHKIGTF